MSDKISITGGQGATNTINDIEYYKLVCETCEYIYNLLAAHCGPHATDALIITDNNRNLKEKHYAIFTKDGINIVRSIEFISPIQKHIQSLIAYIGERVDSLSHDGTTTSMMLFTKLIQSYFEQILDDLHNDIRSSRREMKKDLLTCLFELMQKLENDVITVDRFAEDFKISKISAIKFIAYHQAMLSSKGDTELSTAITEIVETLPVELYGLFSVSQSGIESDKRFTVLHDDFNFMLPVLSNIEDMNHKMRTEYLADKCDLIISEDDLKPGNMALEIIVKHIGKFRQEAFPTQFECEGIDVETGILTVKDENHELPYIAPGTPIQLTINGTPLHNGLWIYNGPNIALTRPVRKKDLVIITKSIDGNLLNEIVKINRKGLNKIVVFTMSVPNPYSSTCTILSAILNTAGAYHLTDHLEDESRNYLIEDAKVHFKNRRLYVSNLYKKDGTQYHPYYNNPELFEPYTKMVNTLKEELDNFTSGRLRFESSQDKYRYEDYVEIYRRMICAEVRNLQISGMTHDVLADRDVLQDSFGAVLSSLEQGFVFDGYLKLNTYMLSSDLSLGWRVLIANAFMDVLASTHRTTPSVISTVISQLVHDDNITYKFYPVDESITDFSSYVINDDDIKEGNMNVYDSSGCNIPLIIQPADTYRELYRRLSDLLPKLINTNRAIVPGTVNESALK